MVKCTSERIAEELAEEIRSGTLRAGAALPSVDALRARFGAGEYAVRRAVKALAVIREETRRCYERLIAELRRHEVRTVVEFDMFRSIDREFKRQFFESGINVERVMCEWDNERRWHLRDLRGTGHATVAEYFSHERHRRHPPDVVLFDDDYLAAGGIAALYEAGFSIPRDIGVVGYANTGNELVYSFSLARIENNPNTYADKVADYVLKVLGGKRAAPPRISRLFVPGDSIA